MDENENDFIVEDDGGEEIPELPTMFSMGTFQDLSHHFKVICQLFVHLAVKPPHQRRSFMKREMNSESFYSDNLRSYSCHSLQGTIFRCLWPSHDENSPGLKTHLWRLPSGSQILKPLWKRSPTSGSNNWPFRYPSATLVTSEIELLLYERSWRDRNTTSLHLRLLICIFCLAFSRTYTVAFL